VLEARELGIPVGMIRPRTLWPFPSTEVLALGGRVKTMIVPEMNLGQMAHEVEWAVRGACRTVPLGRVDGQPIRPAEILDVIRKEARD
jgi:2-oxoglutarate ferredoxin oxidoreductase subunit alpha